MSLLSTRSPQIFHRQTVTTKVGKTNPQRSIGKLLYLKLVMMCDRSVSFGDLSFITSFQIKYKVVF